MCGKNEDCESKFCDVTTGLSNALNKDSKRCLNKMYSLSKGAKCTLAEECSSDDCAGNSHGYTTKLNTGTCTGKFKYISVSGDGEQIMATNDGGATYIASAKSNNPTWTKLKQDTETHKRMRQVDFSNDLKSTEIWAVDFEGTPWYKPDISVRKWTSIDDAPDAYLKERKMLNTKCQCENGTPDKSTRKNMCLPPIQGVQEQTHRCSSCNSGYVLDRKTSHCHMKGYQYEHGGTCGVQGKIVGKEN